MLENLNFQDKMRIVQELIHGKQITLAHIIANPDVILLAITKSVLLFAIMSQLYCITNSP